MSVRSIVNPELMTLEDLHRASFSKLFVIYDSASGYFITTIYAAVTFISLECMLLHQTHKTILELQDLKRHFRHFRQHTNKYILLPAA